MLKNFPKVRKAVGFNYDDEDGYYFEQCARFSNWGIWTSSGLLKDLTPHGRMRDFLSSVWNLGRNIQHDSSGNYRSILLLGPTGTQKEKLAQGIHEIACRDGFQIIRCKDLGKDPQELFRVCQYGGTVFLEGIDELPSKWRDSLMERLKERGESNLLLISSTNKRLEDQGFHHHIYSATPCYPLQVPSLKERKDDIPLLVNQMLLCWGSTDLDDVRHYMAFVLRRVFTKSKVSGDITWLNREVDRWVKEFSPRTPMRLPDSLQDQKLNEDLPDSAESRWALLDWDQITIELVSNDSIRISGGGKSETYHYQKLGFNDGRKIDQPNRCWSVLQKLTEHGEFSWETDIDQRTRNQAKKAIQIIRKKLKEIIGIDEDPFENYRKVKAYKPKFKLVDKRYGGTGIENALKPETQNFENEEDAIDSDILDMMNEEINR
ncbi:MAG: hypothetical protein CMH54_16200 [Myxococcales bacterium]|nr:hypothetical protein [Myxococcales bacterium]